MISRALNTLLLGALLALPAAAYAQEATLSGTVMDSTGSVLPGVTITAVHHATGNRFVAVTDGRGGFRLPVRIGDYAITAELQGFTTVTRGGIQLLVGQNAVVNPTKKPIS
jgi:Carboxypeptidase regulatory-like domain